MFFGRFQVNNISLESIFKIAFVMVFFNSSFERKNLKSFLYFSNCYIKWRIFKIFFVVQKFEIVDLSDWILQNIYYPDAFSTSFTIFKLFLITKEFLFIFFYSYRSLNVFFSNCNYQVTKIMLVNNVNREYFLYHRWQYRILTVFEDQNY